jgi:hypothetical protein
VSTITIPEHIFVTDWTNGQHLLHDGHHSGALPGVNDINHSFFYAHVPGKKLMFSP